MPGFRPLGHATHQIACNEALVQWHALSAPSRSRLGTGDLPVTHALIPMSMGPRGIQALLKSSGTRGGVLPDAVMSEIRRVRWSLFQVRWSKATGLPFEVQRIFVTVSQSR